MELFEAELNRFVQYLSKVTGIKREEIWDDFDEIAYRRLSIKNYRTLIRLWHCKTFEEIAEEFTKSERRKHPLTIDAIRKRAQRTLQIIKSTLEEKYGTTTTPSQV